MAEKPNVGGQSATGSALKIDLDTFSRRLQSLYSHWRNHKDEYWASADVLAVSTPPVSDDICYYKSCALYIWLLGYEFPETIMVFGDKHIHCLCSQKKASFLEVVKRPAREAVDVDVVIHVKARNDTGSTQIDSVIRYIRSQSDDKSTPTVGYMVKETPEGKLSESWANKLSDSGFLLKDITNGFSDLFSVKDKAEIICIKKAAYLTAVTMTKFAVPKVIGVVEEEGKVRHSSLMAKTEKVVLNPQLLQVKLKADNISICYPPVFQSGGNFDLRPSALSNDDYLYYGIASAIICAIGSRYNSYCSNIARTLLIDSTADQRRAYGVLLKAQEAAIGAVKPGTRIGTIYDSSLAVVERDAPDLVQNLTKTAGSGIGLEFRESGLVLNSKNNRVVKAGMVFNVALGFQNLQANTANPKSNNFSLFLADTVIVTEDGYEVVTSISKKSVQDMSFGFNENDFQNPKMKPGPNVKESVYSKATLRSDKGDISTEHLRKQNQAELARWKSEDTVRRLTGAGSETENRQSSSKTVNEVIAYKTVDEIPSSREMIQVDQKHEAILIRMYGNIVIFHVATLKTVTSHQENHRNCYLRITFNAPDTPFYSAIHVKSVCIRSNDPRRISELVNLIKTLKRDVKARESERAERANLVTQERLVLAEKKYKPVRLSELWIRPTFGGRARKLSGTLEAHVNGLKYSTTRVDGRVEIMYRNIKHAIFQPAEKELITLLHFHLHNPIMVGTKKSKDVQFYVEVMEMVQTLGGSRRAAYDPDEIEEEQRERDQKNRINMDFQNFVTRVNDQWKQPQLRGLELEFDQPLRELGFHGVPHKSSAFMIPTTTALVELIENQFVVISLNEIEIINLERVGLAQKNFDMAIVFKDFKRDVMRIDSIPSSSLDGIKEWLDTADIKYYESRLNLNWRPILKSITDDPNHFLEQGGWEFLNLEASDSDTNESEESVYEMSEDEPDLDPEDDDSESESLVESEDDEEEDPEEMSDEDEGKTWEELEREASNADREMGNESDSEDERRRRKNNASNKSRAAPTVPPSKRSKFRQD